LKRDKRQENKAGNLFFFVVVVVEELAACDDFLQFFVASFPILLSRVPSKLANFVRARIHD